ncbi:transcriptional coactivator yorkie isoform X1 [Culicoides brevitarsis]|uniref:transcriptional coactivator yorkie isoform X1 n=1 Tax=Culicoides brevitarsis TaxID=469753 RepID=UPI00307C1A30
MAFNGTTNNENASNNAEGESDSTNKKKNLIILVEKDSEDKLDELFNKALSNKVPLQVPLRMRKLPDSFFNPPSSGSKSPSVSVSHSRENSADSAFGSGTALPTNQVPAFNGGVTSINGLPIHHSRAQSSPASLGIGINLPLGLNAATQGNNASANTATKLNAGNSLNNNNASNATNNLTPNSTQKGFSNLHSRGRSYDVTNLHAHFGPMPEGWEQAKTDDGRIYYINHNNRTTQWEDPRQQMPAAPSPLFSSNSSVETLFNSNTTSPTNQAPGPNTAVTEPTKLNINNTYAMGPLPEGWEEGVTNNGERYYINHVSRTTTWRDPRISNHEWAAHEQSLRLYNLQMERERLRRRQQEIKSHIGEDPFLPANLDTHTRQESGDSGLSLPSSTSQSVSHTPDFLSNIDDSMDGLSVADNTMDTMPFTDNIDNSDEFMLNDPLLLERFDADAVDNLIAPSNNSNNNNSNRNGANVFEI